MTKRDVPPAAAGIRQPAKLISTCDSQQFDYIEPSLTCAAQHALSILDLEEGCVHRIEVQGEVIWEFDSKRPKQSIAKLETLATGVCRK